MTATTRPLVRTGLDILAAEHSARLRGQRVGLVAHPASIDSTFRHAVDILAQAPGVHLTTVFGPEHGFAGTAQDLVPVSHSPDASSRVRFVSLYGETVESLKPTADHLNGIDTLVIDLQDIGSRYYTFQATMLFCLERAAEHDVRVLVLDRPNPIAGLAVEGPGVEPGFDSFVGVHSIPVRHGMTIGELSLLYRAELAPSVELEVLACDGWKRSMWFNDTDLPWVMPSPNMPTLETATVYPGQCLLEGTNISEGRGTTRPFEFCGAPWIDGSKLASSLNALNLPGVFFRAAAFRPTFHKFADQDCQGVQIHVVDRIAFQPLRTTWHLLRAVRRVSIGRFDWRREPYEFVAHPPAIDLLLGSNAERHCLESDADPDPIFTRWREFEEAFRQRRLPFLLYSS